MDTVVINECSINKDGTMMTLRASVDNREEFNNLYIEAVKIDTGKTFVDNGPSDKAKTIEIDGPVYAKVYTEDNSEVSDLNESPILLDNPGPKDIILYIKPSQLDLADFNKDIFFIYIYTNNTAEVDGETSSTGAMTVVANLRKIYDKSMAYIKELERTCKIPTGFIDRILRLKAFELSLKTGNYVEAIDQWGKLVERRETVNPDSQNANCNCMNTWNS